LVIGEYIVLTIGNPSRNFNRIHSFWWRIHKLIVGEYTVFTIENPLRNFGIHSFWVENTQVDCCQRCLLSSLENRTVKFPSSAVLIAMAEPVGRGPGRGSKFRRSVGGPLVGGVDIMMSFDPKTVVHMACSPLLHYAFRVAKIRGGHD
jgi:hypothetical protein